MAGQPGTPLCEDKKMASVYLLFHTHHLPDGEEDDKLLSVYSSREVAEKKIEEKYRSLPGFCEPDGESSLFLISIFTPAARRSKLTKKGTMGHKKMTFLGSSNEIFTK